MPNQVQAVGDHEQGQFLLCLHLNLILPVMASMAGRNTLVPVVLPFIDNVSMNPNSNEDFSKTNE